ncbi:uncharacterized protein N7483_009585 [Penicillium malachiteum]|uniref:uncharacterized protein n=1 Tax=Penicillium malachiteum TaxID=1324776 RepID=UPI002548486A|nr:uncharacterized protein N7483_009585 [Penicillium malachiteum]KAJ5721651.1 hypothetical protein N7483_009585 [Penicillium malachiteum]
MASPTQRMVLNTLFGGTRFWVSYNVPQRTRFKEMIEEHGGIVVLLETHANVKLVDHTKKNLPSDVYSYQYVERSVRNGKLENLEDHRAGPSAQRPMGASHIPQKRTRTEFTLKDDQILFDYLNPYELVENAPISGHRIYQALAEKFPQHTYQSWRNRYLKSLRGRPRPGGGEPRSDVLDEIDQSRPSSTTANERAPSAKEPKVAEPEPKRRSTSDLTRNPEVSVEIITSRAPKGRPDTPSNSKSKRERPVDSPSRRRRDSGPPSAKKAILMTPEAINSIVRTISNPRPNQHKSPSKSPSKACLPPVDSETRSPSTTSQSHKKQPSQPKPDTATHPTPTPNSPTLIQSFFIALKEQGDIVIDPLFSELPLPEVSSESEVEETDQEDTDLDTWIDSQLSRGIELATVGEVLRRTSMNPEYAKPVLDRCVAGEGIPNDMPGVWSAEDDKKLDGADGRDIQALIDKHGNDSVNARWEYLHFARKQGIL